MTVPNHIDRLALYLELILTVLHPFLIPLAGMTTLVVLLFIKRHDRKGNDRAR